MAKWGTKTYPKMRFSQLVPVGMLFIVVQMLKAVHFGDEVRKVKGRYTGIPHLRKSGPEMSVNYFLMK